MAQEILKEQETTETMSIEIENKLDRIIQLLEELLQERQNPSNPTQGEDTEWHNPEQIRSDVLGWSHRFLKTWEFESGILPDGIELLYMGLWQSAKGFPLQKRWTYRVPITTTIPPRP